MPQCPKCGQPVAEAMPSCPYCGSPMNATPPPVQPAQQAPQPPVQPVQQAPQPPVQPVQQAAPQQPPHVTPPPGGYGAPQQSVLHVAGYSNPQYGNPPPPPQYGAPQGGPQPQYGAPQGGPQPGPQYGPQYGAPQGQYSAPPPPPPYGGPQGGPPPGPQFGGPQPNPAGCFRTNTGFIRGPLGEDRSPVMVILLSLITCGIYGIIWQYKVSQEINRYVGADLTSPSLVIFGLFCFPLFYVNLYKLDMALFRIDAEEGRMAERHFLLWLILMFVGIGMFFAMYQIQDSLNDVWAQFRPRPHHEI